MNENTKDIIVDNPEPNWSIEMFMEDLKAIFEKIAELIASLFNAL